MNYVRKHRGKKSEDEIKQIFSGGSKDYLPVRTGYISAYFLRNWDILKQLKFIATFYEVKKIFSNELNNSLQWAELFLLKYMKQLAPGCSF